MNVLIVNTSQRTGGAAIAASRLAEALAGEANVTMLVRDKAEADGRTVALPPSWRHKARFLYERGLVWLSNGRSRSNLFQLDIANAGADITTLPEFKKADVVHLHWINQGMLSLKTIGRIMRSGKPVVWTMHDMWPFTGICHYADGCRRFTTQCNNCPQLNGHGSRGDISWRTFCKKKQIYSLAPMTFVGCSRWIALEAEKSALLKGHKVTNIPNPIDTALFAPIKKEEARKALGLDPAKNYLLFTAMNVADPRKGFDILCESLNLWATRNRAEAKRTELLIVGKNASQLAGVFKMLVRPMDYVTETTTLINIYNAANVFITPSQQDNLPNTVMEALSCGTPCIGCNIGGIPEMIENGSCGIVVEPGGNVVAGFADAVAQVLQADENCRMSEAARKKSLTCYSQTVVAKQYLNLYKSLIKW
ncbi:MAG: glycosyltransferase family 4 protein [Muribaculum sp.]|nr:glycosyltransferase family 4 protein [Muribaculaceae bacterium]MCM1081198.1 glycosyltransferase family 4 protein [Muribaculum sp.]